MSTQSNDVVAFSILPEEKRDHFRLLELPPDLLDLLTSRPSSTLQFKSTEHTNGSEAGAGAVICTSDRTYNVRQVHSSNSVYICRPTESADDEDDKDTSISQCGLQAIAQSSWTLELSQAKATTAAPYLRAILPSYSSTGTYQSRVPVSKQQLFDNVPLSNAECEQAWAELACFELKAPEGCFLPTASAKVQAWRSILDQAVASGVDLTASIAPDQVGFIIDENDTWPTELSYALLRSVSAAADGVFVIDETKCVASVGLNQLAASSQAGRTLGVSDFLASWRDLLPEKWRVEAKLERLPRSEYTLGDNGRSIAFAGGAVGPGGSIATDGNSAVGAKRKWHEKFRAAKKAG